MQTTVKELLYIFLSLQAQDMEDGLQSLLSKWDIANVEGEPLNEIADLVGLKNKPTDTDILRAFIYGQIAANTSDGTFTDIYTVCKNIFTAFGGSNIIIVEEPPMQIKIFTDAAIPASVQSDIISILSSSLAVTVKLAGIAQYPDGTYFRYDGTTAEAYDNGKYSDFIV